MSYDSNKTQNKIEEKKKDTRRVFLLTDCKAPLVKINIGEENQDIFTALKKPDFTGIKNA